MCKMISFYTIPTRLPRLMGFLSEMSDEDIQPSAQKYFSWIITLALSEIYLYLGTTSYRSN